VEISLRHPMSMRSPTADLLSPSPAREAVLAHLPLLTRAP
jgi:hypothetical protein